MVGDPYHLSDVHNHFWYRDPSDDRMHPIPWDVFLRSLAEGDSRQVSTILRALLREPEILDGALRYIHERAEGGALRTRIEDLLSDLERRYRYALDFDRLRAGAVSEVGEPGSAMELVKGNLELLGRWIDDSRVVMSQTRVAADRLILDLEVRGHVGVDFVALEFDGDLEDDEVVIEMDLNRSGMLDPGEPRVYLRRSTGDTQFRFPNPEPLLAGTDTSVGPFRPAPIHYRFLVRTSMSTDLPPARPVLVNRISQQSIDAQPIAAEDLVSVSVSHHPWDLPSASESLPTQRVVSGVVDVTEDLLVPEQETLLVEAGTRFRIAPQVSFIVFGRILAQGTRTLPIVFEPLEQDKPWGTMALIGDGAAGSRFTNCRFERGSGGVYDGVTFKGMVSVHRVPEVSFEGCRFSRNLVTDDALNAVHSHVRLETTEFLDANADSVDFDISSGLVRSCAFYRSGNDAIDLMTSDVAIIDNLIVDSGDKGISVGEASSPLILGNDIRSCKRGIEVKDASEPWIVDNRLQDNDVNVLVMKKNWRYGEGGFAKLVNSESSDDYENVVLKSDSRLSVPYSGGAEIADAVLKSFGVRRADLTNEGLGEASWVVARPEYPLDSQTFQEDFHSMTDGWTATGMDSRLAKRGRDLVLELRSLGSLRREINWNLDENAILVLDLGSDGIESLDIRLMGDRRVISKTVSLREDPGRFSLVAVDVSADQYSRLEIEARVRELTGRLFLHRYWLAPRG